MTKTEKRERNIIKKKQKELKYVPTSTIISFDSIFVIPLEFTEIAEFPYPLRLMLELLRDRRDLESALAVPVLMTYASAQLSKSVNIVL